MRALYFIFATFSTIGYGDISAVNRKEMVWCLFILFSGQLLFSFILERMRKTYSSTDEMSLKKVQSNLKENAELMLI